VNDITDQAHNTHRVSDVNEEPDAMLLPIEGYERKPLVSLEEAVVPLIQLVTDIKRKAWIAKTRAKNPADGLTSDESAAIILYSMEWPEDNQSLYHILNSTLRAEKRSLLKPWFLYLKLVLTGFNKLPSLEGRTFYRGVKQDLSSNYPPGKTIVWWGFSSCSSTIDVLEREEFLGKTGTRTLFTIECKNAKNIRYHSMFADENEVLLMPATQLEVVGRYHPSSDVHIVQLKETEPLYPLRDPV
jgi:hypothetical protein